MEDRTEISVLIPKYGHGQFSGEMNAMVTWKAWRYIPASQMIDMQGREYWFTMETTMFD